MNLYFIRHGIAADPLDYSQDGDRPLTSKGQEKTIQVAKKIRQLDIHFAHLFTSPLVRARQTAQIFQEQGLTSQLEVLTALAPAGNLQDLLHRLAASSYQSDDCLALVGHQPDLGDWAEKLVWGEVRDKLILKKAGIIGVNFAETAIAEGQGQLFLLTSPKWLSSDDHCSRLIKR
jgi:phosphohistidine phosphatase